MSSIERMESWIGRREVADDVLTARRYVSVAATLDQEMPWPDDGAAIPPAWHWAYFTPITPSAALAVDGHAALGGFLPPVGLPRRMWAGGRIAFLRPLTVGAAAQRVSTVKAITEKAGRTGRLVFVVLEHQISIGGQLCLREGQDIVYREAPALGAREQTPSAAPADAEFCTRIVPTPSLLFRYSALTFNSHRIHLDRDYCREVEGYPGLVVHGPLIATLLLELVRDNLPDAHVTGFSFRAVSPLFDTHAFTVNGRRDGDTRVVLWAANEDGGLATTGEVELA